MIRDRNSHLENRGVSPVVGVTILIGITVILSTTVGAYLLLFTANQKPTPTASFATEERIVYLDNRPPNGPNGGDDFRFTEVKITHNGGDTLDIPAVEVVVEGNRTAMGLPGGRLQRAAAHGNECDGCIVMRPQPEIVPPNRRTETVAAGATWSVVSYQAENSSLAMSDARFVQGGYYSPKRKNSRTTFRPHCFSDTNVYNVGACSTMEAHIKQHPLDSGDKIHVVWTSQSGGQSQTLFTYTVERRSPYLDA